MHGIKKAILCYAIFSAPAMAGPSAHLVPPPTVHGSTPDVSVSAVAGSPVVRDLQIENAIKRTEIVVVAEYTGEHHEYPAQTSAEGGPTYEFQFKNIQTLKGEAAKKINVWRGFSATYPKPTDVGQLYKPGAQYLLFLSYVVAHSQRQIDPQNPRPTTWYNQAHPDMIILLKE